MSQSVKCSNEGKESASSNKGLGKGSMIQEGMLGGAIALDGPRYHSRCARAHFLSLSATQSGAR